MRSIGRRLDKLEEVLAPKEIQLSHLVNASMDPDYSAWLDDEVAAGRMRHGIISMLITKTGSKRTGRELTDAEAWAIVNEDNKPAPPGEAKPPRPEPAAEPRVPEGYRRAMEGSTAPSASSDGPPAMTPEPAAATLAPRSGGEEPARAVRYVRTDSLERNSMDYDPLNSDRED